jgi:hypothetical protein
MNLSQKDLYFYFHSSVCENFDAGKPYGKYEIEFQICLHTFWLLFVFLFPLKIFSTYFFSLIKYLSEWFWNNEFVLPVMKHFTLCYLTLIDVRQYERCRSRFLFWDFFWRDFWDGIWGQGIKAITRLNFLEFSQSIYFRKISETINHKKASQKPFKTQPWKNSKNSNKIPPPKKTLVIKFKFETFIN